MINPGEPAGPADAVARKTHGTVRQDVSRKAPGEIRIGYVHLEALCWTFFRYHLMIKTSQLGMNVLDRAVSTLPEQLAEIDKLLREEIDVLMLRPVASGDADLLAAVGRARALGVQIIALDGALGGAFDTTSVSVDNSGGQAGLTAYICQRLNGKGRIAHLQGNQNMEAGQLRTHGLHGVLTRYPGVTLVHEVELDWGSPVPLHEQGAALARSVLAAHPELDAIITTSDEAAFGVSEVLLEVGLQNRVLLTGFDALPEALIAIADGRMEASVHQPLEMMAERALHDAIRLVRVEPGSVTHTRMPAETISRANLAEATLNALRLFPSVISELDQRRAEQQASAAFLETLIDSLPSAVVVKDAETLAYVRRNRAADDWLGVPHGSQLGKTAFDIFPPEIAARFHASDRAALAQGDLVSIPEEESYLPGVGTRFVSTHKIPVFDNHGKPIFLMAISEDITERKMAETALAHHAHELEAAIEELKRNRQALLATEKMAALGSLVAGVAHELNTPIGNGMLTASALLESALAISGKSPDGLSRSILKEYLADALDGADILERNLHRAADLINSFKQIAVDQTSAQMRRFSLSTLVVEVVLALWPSIKRTPFTVQQAVPDHIMMETYAGSLEQVLINLINNAVIHGLEGRDSGRIGISASLCSPDSVQLIVEDDGKGIPEELLDKVFSPFFTTKSDDGGSGLGLSITHGIVTGLLGGEIEMQSSVGSGTRFCITLPLSRKPQHGQG